MRAYKFEKRTVNDKWYYLPNRKKSTRRMWMYNKQKKKCFVNEIIYNNKSIS